MEVPFHPAIGCNPSQPESRSYAHRQQRVAAIATTRMPTPPTTKMTVLAVLLAAGCSSPAVAAASAGGGKHGPISPATAGFVTLPARTSAASDEPRLPVRPKRIPTAKTSLPGKLYLSVAADAPATGASSSVKEDEKRAAIKSALLGVFGESVKDGDEGQATPGDPILACPSTLGDLTDGVRSYGGVGPGSLLVAYKSSNKRPGVKYPIGTEFVDFAEPLKPTWSLSRGEAVKEGTFQTPLVSWLYERGWRQGFSANGFPGIDEEFRLVSEYFSSTGADGKAVVDLSCGSGLMMRRLVSSGRYSRVIGGDLSPTMLAETARRFREEDLGAPELIRCDVSRLPLKTESLDGVHAGAALHCWSKLEDSLSEVHRVLKPGRGFFATTFLNSAVIGNSVGNSRRGDGFKFFELAELEQLMRNAGFEDVEVVKEGRACAIVRATKRAE
ncbi:unnamed protein product [Ectocarpus sp. 13 AM-2016]